MSRRHHRKAHSNPQDLCISEIVDHGMMSLMKMLGGDGIRFTKSCQQTIALVYKNGRIIHRLRLSGGNLSRNQCRAEAIGLMAGRLGASAWYLTHEGGLVLMRSAVLLAEISPPQTAKVGK